MSIMKNKNFLPYTLLIGIWPKIFSFFYCSFSQNEFNVNRNVIIIIIIIIIRICDKNSGNNFSYFHFHMANYNWKEEV